MADDYCEFCEKNLKAFAKRCWNCKRIFDHNDYLHFGRPDKDPHIEPYTLVKLSDESKQKYESQIINPFKDSKFLFIHEITNMLGHVYVVGLETGKNYIGFHEETFVELSDEEI